MSDVRFMLLCAAILAAGVAANSDPTYVTVALSGVATALLIGAVALRAFG